MSSGTLTYPMATPVNLSMALTMKMKHRRLLKARVMLPVRFLFAHQWTDNTLPDLTVNEPPMLPHVRKPSMSSEPPHVCTPSVSSEPPHVHTPSKLFPGHTPSSSIPLTHSDETMSVAQILADLADGGGEQPEPKPEPEEVVFEDQTLEEIDIDLLVSVQRPVAIKFKPFSLFCRKPTGAVHVGKQKGLKKNVGLRFTGLSKVCGDDFEVKPIGGDGNCFFRMISYLLLGVDDKHDIIRASIVEYIVNPDNLVGLRSYIPQEFSTGEEYVKAKQMHLSTTWATEMELFACAQLSGKDVVCYFGKQWPISPNLQFFQVVNWAKLAVLGHSEPLWWYHLVVW